MIYDIVGGGNMKVLGIVGVIILVILVIGVCLVDLDSEKNINSVNIDALKKCTVMEGADIYATGGQKSVNVFKDAKKTCEKMYQDWGEKEFTEIVNEDWNNRQYEELEGQTLSHYLEVLWQ